MSKTKTFVFICILAVLLGVALATLCVSSQSAEASTIYDYEEFYKRYYTDLGINDNLLLNSDFSKNSNGKLKYSGADYAVDSWKGIGSGSQMSISSSFITLTNTTAFNVYYKQVYADSTSLLGKTVTISGNFRTVSSGCGIIAIYTTNASTPTNWTQFGVITTSQAGVFSVTKTFPSSGITYISFDIGVMGTSTTNGDISIAEFSWVKAEIAESCTSYMPNSEELYRDFMECNNPNFVDFFSTTGSSATVDGDNYVHDYTLSDYLANNGINSTSLNHNSCLTFSIPEVWTSTTAGGNREFTCFWDAATQSYTDADNSFYFYLNEPCVTVSSKVSDLQLWKPKYIYIYDFGDVYNDGFNNGLTVGELYSQYEIIDKVDLSTVLTSSDFHDSVLSSGSVITSEDNPIGYSSIPWENSSTLNYINDNFSNLYLLLYDKNSSNFFLLTPSDDVIIDGVNYGNLKAFGYFVQNNISTYSIQVGSTYFALSLDFFIDNLFLTSVLYLVELKDDDDYVLYDRIWNSGYDTGFNVPYEIVYNDWKDEFYDTTYDAGYDAGYNHAQYNEIVTWNDFIPSIIGAFASFFLILLDIDVFGSNLLTLIGSIGACFLVIIIIKKLSGK